MNQSKKRFFSIQAKITLWGGLCLLFCGAVLVAFSIISVTLTSRQAAENEVISQAGSYARDVQAALRAPLDTAQALSGSLAGIKASRLPVDREVVLAMLEQVLVENPAYTGVYTAWEAGTFDGRDSQFKSKPGHDKTGRFVPYWSRSADGQIYLDPVSDYQTSDAYMLPFSTHQAALIEPRTTQVHGQAVEVISLVVPILNEDQYLGMVGIDVNIDYLQGLADSVNIYGGAATVLLVTQQGTIVGATGSPDQIGQPLSSLDPSSTESGLIELIRQGGSTSSSDRNNLLVVTPVQVGQTGTPWSVLVHVPMDRVNYQSTMLAWRFLAIGAFLVLVSLVMLWFAAGQVVRPLRMLTDMANAVIIGDLEVEVPVMASDETGNLAKTFNKMIERLRDMLGSEQQLRSRLQKTVEQYAVYLNDVSNGNLSARIDVKSSDASDPLVRLGMSLNDLTSNLQATVGQIHEASKNLSTAATEIMATTTQQASGASEQSAAIAQTTTTVDEVKTIAEQSSLRAQEVASSAQRTLEVSRGGQRAVQDTIESMAQIKERVEGIAENILALSEQTQQIGEIISTVNDIASQSNMLALNASVEAARAGEHGKGFAVVAVEVRNLAEQSKQATAQVKAILSEIQKATNSTVMATEEGAKGVDHGVQLAAQARDAIDQLTGVIGESAQAAVQMVAGGQQQGTGIDQVAMAMRNINQATLQSLSSTRQAERAAQNLNVLARQLSDMVSRYRLS